jgi:serine/threonine protein kinase
MVMELVEGTNLRELVHRSGGLPPRQILQIGAGVCAALDAAHRSGIVHRDVKSSNIMVTPQGGVKVLDFGLAKAIPRAAEDPTPHQEPVRSSPVAGGQAEPDDLTQRGVVVGTVNYMSPEKASFPRADRPRGATGDSDPDAGGSRSWRAQHPSRLRAHRREVPG